MGATFFGQGILMALDPLVSQAAGANDQRSIALAVQRGIILAAGLTIPLALYHLAAGPVLRLFSQPADVVPLARDYTVALIPGLLPYFGFIVLRQTLQALHRLRAIVLTILVANLANVVINWVFIFGKLGLPALGVSGAAIATSSSRWLMLLLLLALSWRELGPLLRRWLPAAWGSGPLMRMLRLGIPIALHMELELTCFGAVALLAGAMGTVQIAGHQIAISMAALTYMVPLGVSAAAAVMVGRAVGAGDPIDARRQATTALVVGVGFMTATALVFLTVPGPLARLYTTDAAVIGVAAALVPLAGVFQVFDGTQVVAIGILRGLADTRGPFVINALGYWAIGMPVGLVLAYPLGLGVVGLWWGLVIGLGTVGIILLVRTWRTFRRPLPRLDIEQAAA
jgi:MATE family multidrug resistance protein